MAFLARPPCTRIHLYATGADSWAKEREREREKYGVYLYNRQVLDRTSNRENGIYF